uniref:GATA-type domain-containing protein n=1 Tax=Meloidogyne hapla TaxID=6305 RepID=A0A1I8BFX0_MELHA
MNLLVNFFLLKKKYLSLKIIDSFIKARKRHCFNCGVTQTKEWRNYLNNFHLCNSCGTKNVMKIHKLNDRKCYNCGVTQTSLWRRLPENKKYYLCNACGNKQWRKKRKGLN